MQIFYRCLLIIGGFLFGSVMFCELIPKKLFKKDIFELSTDSNPGAFNVFKYCGKKLGIPCLVLDLMKGFVPALLASLFMKTEPVVFPLAMTAPVLGHAIGLFNRFHGGKCVAVSFGVLLGITPVAWFAVITLAALYVFYSTIIKINPGSMRSIFVYVQFMIIVCTLCCAMKMYSVAIGCAAVALLPIVKFAFFRKTR